MKKPVSSPLDEIIQERMELTKDPPEYIMVDWPEIRITNRRVFIHPRQWRKFREISLDHVVRAELQENIVDSDMFWMGWLGFGALFYLPVTFYLAYLFNVKGTWDLVAVMAIPAFIVAFFTAKHTLRLVFEVKVEGFYKYEVKEVLVSTSRQKLKQARDCINSAAESLRYQKIQKAKKEIDPLQNRP